MEALRRLRRGTAAGFLLESVTGGDQVARYSFLASGPSRVLRLYSDRADVEEGGGTRRLPGAPLAAFTQELQRVEGARSELPFAGGWVGYFGFEMVGLLERLPPPPPDLWGLPLAVVARFDSGAAFDHVHQRLVLFANEIEGEVSAAAAGAELDRLAELLDVGTGYPFPHDLPPGLASLGEEMGILSPLPPSASAEPTWSGDAFQEAVRQAQDHITRGDAFQIVLARRFRMGTGYPFPKEQTRELGSPGVEMGILSPLPLQVYRALRVINPSPYMVLLELPDVALAGASPEMLVRVTGRRVEARPIAGTRRRGATLEEDRRLAAELLADPKERAEHLMLVDLGRNDLGRIAGAGSVRVEELMQIERYSHVMHIVSGLSADLAPGKCALDALLACFPAGTVSGAPKIRAMEILRELEPEARGPYAGAVGYLSFSGDLDTCITIRTVICRGGELSVTAGAGIVADSRPATEEQETEDKAAALLAAVGLAERFA